MEHTDIAPLARRLAEENNVEWRRLRGSGENGRVVERDVLEYLARVMAGEEDVDPTPEPLPEGMEAWPDADVRAFASERPPEEVPPAYGTSTVDDEIFLLDGEDEPGEFGVEEAEPSDAGSALHAGRSTSARFDDGLDLPSLDDVIDDFGDDDDLLVAGDDRASAEAPASADAAAAWPAAARRDEVESVFAARGHAGAPTDRGDPGVDLLPDLFDDRPADAPWSGPVFGDAGLGSRDEAPLAPDLEVGTNGVDASVDGSVGGGGNWSRFTGADLELEDEAFEDTVASRPDVELRTSGVWADAPRRVDASTAFDAPTSFEDRAPFDDPAATESSWLQGDDGGDAGGAEGTARSSDGEPAADRDSASLAPAAPRAAADPVRAAEHRPASGTQGLPLVSHGAIFRRQVDLSNLVAAQAVIARDLGLADPVPAIVFLARAAVKALGEQGSVALAVFDLEAVHTRPLATHGAFGDVVARVASGAPEANQDRPDLVVADLSDLDLDEAVLHLDVPVLSLGRVLIDTSTGGRRATLALSGDAVGSDAGRLLARVADLLETPIRVVL